MKLFTRKATSTWLSTRQDCNGNLTTPGGTLKKIRCLPSTNHGLGGASRPELIATAHADSFSMALAHELGVAGYSPDQIDTTATVTMENLAVGWTLTRIHLDVIATVPNAMQCDFIDAALLAKLHCPISRLLKAKISMRAKLERRATVAPISESV